MFSSRFSFLSVIPLQRLDRSNLLDLANRVVLFGPSFREIKRNFVRIVDEETKYYHRVHDVVLGLRGSDIGVSNHGHFFDTLRVCHHLSASAGGAAVVS